jgi:hypothetical protein
MARLGTFMIHRYALLFIAVIEEAFWIAQTSKSEHVLKLDATIRNRYFIVKYPVQLF